MESDERADRERIHMDSRWKDVESEPLLRRQLEVLNSGEGVKEI